MIELLMEHYGVTYAQAVELMEMPIMEAVVILNSILESKKQGKTEN